MEQEHGREASVALAKYQSVSVMTREIATEIVGTLWGDAPAIEKTKAIILCHTYNLNPLMKHLHLVKYNKWDRDHKKVIGADWAMMLGIGATRLMAQRKHNYSYLDFTPRKATQEEIDKILGDTAKSGEVYGFVHIKDVDTGAESFGLRGISTKANIKGEDKGNTHLNMACVRAERLALDRQYPGEMPQGVEVIDEAYVELPDIGKVSTGTGEIIEGEARELGPEAEKDDSPIVFKDDPPPGPEEVLNSNIDLDWMRESIKTLQDRGEKAYFDENMLSYMNMSYKVEGTDIYDIASKLDKGSANHLWKLLQEALEKK